MTRHFRKLLARIADRRAPGWLSGLCWTAAVGITVALLVLSTADIKPPILHDESGKILWSRVAATVILGIGFLLLATIPNFLHQWICEYRANRLKSATAFFSNHDLTAAVGQALRLILIDAANPRENDRLPRLRQSSTVAWLEQYAGRAPEAWSRVVRYEHDPEVSEFRNLFEQELWRFVADRRRTPLTDSAWMRFLSWLNDDRETLPFLRHPDDAGALVQRLNARFGEALWEFMKHDFVVGGHADKALDLLISQQLLARTAAMAEGIEKLQTALEELTKEWRERLPKVEETLSRVDRHQQEALALCRSHGRVLRRIEQKLDALLRESRKISARVGSLDANVEVVVRFVRSLKLADGRSFADALDAEELGGRTVDLGATLRAAQPPVGGEPLPDGIREALQRKDTRRLLQVFRRLLGMRRWREQLSEPDLALVDGRLAFALGEFEAAAAHFRRALEHRPGDPSGTWDLASALVATRGSEQEERLREGIALLENLRDNPHPSLKAQDVVAALAVSRCRLARTADISIADAAESEMRTALSLQPGEVNLLRSYALFLETVKRDRTQAEIQYRKALEADDGDSIALTTYARFVARDPLRRDEARALFERAVQARPDDRFAWTSYGRFLTGQGAMAEARAAYERACELDPKDPIVLTALAGLLARGDAKDREQAELLYLQARQRAPLDPIVGTEYARFLESCGSFRIDAAEKVLRDVCERAPRDVVCRCALARLLAQHRGDIQAALLLFREAVQIAPNDLQSRTQFARFLARRPEHEKEAEEQFEAALSLDVHDALTHVLYARFLSQAQSADRRARGEEHFLEALRLNPVDGLGCYWFALHLEQTGRRDEAEQQFRRAVELEPSKAYILDAYGRFLHRDPGRRDEAAAAMQRAAELNPMAVFTRGARRHVAANSELRKMALKGLQDRLAFAPRNGAAHFQLARLLAQEQKTWSEAGAHYAEAAELMPDEPTVVEEYARFLAYCLADRAGAKRQFERAISLSVNAAGAANPLLCGQYARFLARDPADWSLAEDYFRRACAIDARNPQIVLSYARFLAFSARDRDRARELFEEAVRLLDGPYPRVVFAAFLSQKCRDRTAAEKQYLAAIDCDPGNARTLSAYATFLTEDKHTWSRAEATYEQALEADPENSITHASYAKFLHRDLRLTQRAGDHFRRALELSPDNAIILTDYARFRWETHGDFEETVSYFEKAVAADDEDPILHTSFADFLSHEFDKAADADAALERAEKAFRRAIELEPHNDRTIANFAVFLWKSRRKHSDAREQFSRAVLLAPRNDRTIGSFVAFLCSTRREQPEIDLSRRAQRPGVPLATRLGIQAALILTAGSMEAGEVVLQRAVEAAEASGDAPDQLDLWVTVAVFDRTKLREASLAKLRRLLVQEGRRSNTHLPLIVCTSAYAAGRSDAKWLRQLGDVACAHCAADALEEWPLWRAAA